MSKNIEFDSYSTILTIRYNVRLIYLCVAMLMHSHIILICLGRICFLLGGERGRGGLARLSLLCFCPHLLQYMITKHQIETMIFFHQLHYFTIKKASDLNDGFLPSFVIFYDKKASDLNDGFLSSFVIFYDYKASDLNDGFQASFVILTVFKHQISKKA